MALFLTEKDVDSLFPMAVALEAVEGAAREHAVGSAVNHPRSRLHDRGSTLQYMAGSLPAWGVFGYKAYATTRLSRRFLTFLYSIETGELLTVLEADKLSQMRTGAASGVATKYMARANAKKVGIIGSGWQARSQLMAVCAVRPIETIRAYSRDPEHRRTFAEEMTQTLGVAVEAVDSPEATIDGADIIITATSSSQPVLKGEWLSPGVHVNAIGANSILRREIDDTVIQRSGIIAVDSKDQARIEAAAFVYAIERGQLQWERIRELGDVVTGLIPGRQREDEVTLFMSLGIAIWDIAAAHRVYQLAKERGVGQPLPL